MASATQTEEQPVAEEIPTRTTWEKVFSNADKFIGGEIKLIGYPGSGQEKILRGPLIDLSNGSGHIWFNPVWLGEQVPNETGDLWFNSKLTYTLSVDDGTEVFVFKDGRVRFEIPRIVRGTLFPKGRSDRLDPDMVQSLPKGWERLLDMVHIVRDRLAINYEALDKIALMEPFDTLPKSLVRIGPSGRIGDLLSTLTLPDADKELMLKLYLEQIIGRARLDAIVY